MAEYKLTNKAVEDLSKIWEYTSEEWSENQADKYYQSILDHCQEIANNPTLGRSYDGVDPNLFGFKISRHIIFFRTLNENYVEIIRILHEKMDLRNRLL